MSMHGTMEALEIRRLLSGGGDFFTQTNLVSDGSVASVQPADPKLVNAWGISNLPGSPFWVSSNEKGLALLYDGQGVKSGLEVNIPASGGGDAAPTGNVAHTGSG